jgi:hypothetical protein
MAKEKSKTWDIPDLVDLEYFLSVDADIDEAVLVRRDRELYRSQLAQAVSTSRRDLLYRWLDLRRETARIEHSQPLPGEVIASVLRPLPMLLFILGILSGVGLASGVLIYAGDQPINLFVALILLVALPFLSALFLALLPALRLAVRGSFSGGFGVWMIGTLLTHLSQRLSGRSGDGRSKLALANSFGILRGRGRLYSGVIGWLAFRLMQSLALGFSLAVFLTVLFRGWVADLAFSWQTTTRISAEQVHGFIAALARPWAGLANPPYSYPTVEQVEGSRVFLKEGLQNLSSSDLQSWWYFLLWAILVYTVLPRLVLMSAALLGSRYARGRLTFRDARSEAVIRRMQHPLLHVDKGDETPLEDPLVEVISGSELRDKVTRIRALVPEELMTEHGQELWQGDLQREFNASVDAVIPVRVDEEEDADALQRLAGETSQVPIVLVLEGWQPCIIATQEYLKSLRRLIGKDHLLIVALVGRQDREGCRAPTSDHEFGIWHRRLATLGDPMLLVHNWSNRHE